MNRQIKASFFVANPDNGIRDLHFLCVALTEDMGSHLRTTLVASLRVQQDLNIRNF